MNFLALTVRRARIQPCWHVDGFCPFRPLALMVFLACSWIPSLAMGAEPGVDELVNLVLDAQRSNYVHIKSARLTLSEVLEDSTVQQEQDVVQRLPNGTEVRFRKSPRIEYRVQLSLRDGDVRADRVRVDQSAETPSETNSFRNGTWTQYAEQQALAWIHRTEELPGMFPIDPRQLGSDDVKRSLMEILREDRIISANMTDADEGQTIIRIVAESDRGAQTTYEFGAEQNFLPTRLQTNWPDGSILQLVDYEYQDVLDGQAKFLKKLNRRFFAQGVTHVPAGDGWRQRCVQEVLDDIVFNREISDETFQVSLPIGTRVSDSIRRAVYTVAAPIDERPVTWWWYLLAISCCLTALVCVRAYKGNLAR